VSELRPVSPTSAKMMSLAFDVLTPVTVGGWLLQQFPNLGRLGFVSNGPAAMPEKPAAMMLVCSPSPEVVTVIVSEAMLEAPTFAHHSSISWVLPVVSDVLRANTRPEESVTVVTVVLAWS